MSQIKNRKIYFIGIGGIAMANLACLLKNQGYLISGSDLDTFGPSASLLKKCGIKYFRDHSPSHINKFKPGAVVVGNAIQRGNPSLEYVLDKQIPYFSMPEIIKTKVIQNKKSIVIAGTSGKTTTTALIAWILHKAGLKPTALIGGIAKNFNSGFLAGKGLYVVTEGDEYGSSFDDPSPKFIHYSPHIAVVNNIQPDHLDIYGSIKNIIKAFKKLPPLIPKSGLLILNSADRNSQGLSKVANSKIETFGQKGFVSARNIKTSSVGLDFDLYRNNKLLGKIKTGLLGRHNAENILSASAVALNIGIPFKKLAGAVATFEGVKRRLEIIYSSRSKASGRSGNIKIIDDFAHNPDKVFASLLALRDHFPKHKIVAIFEPRTGSSRRKFFQKAYVASFKPADLVYIAEPYKKEALNKKELFSSQQLVRDLNKKGIESYALPDATTILASVKHRMFNRPVSNSYPAIFVIMSSGDFDGIHQKLINLVS